MNILTQIPQDTFSPSYIYNRLNVDPNYGLQLAKINGLDLTPGNPRNLIPCTVSSWYIKGIPIFSYLIFNETRLMSGDIGPEVESSGRVIFLINNTSKLLVEVQGKLSIALLKVGYSGPINVEVLTGDKTVVKGINATINQDDIAIFTELLGTDFSNLLNYTRSNLGPFNPRFKAIAGILIYTFLSQGDYIVPVTGINKSNIKHIQLKGIEKTNSGEYVCAGDSIPLTVTARGELDPRYSAIREARRRALRTLSNVKIDGLMYRNDIGKSAEVKINKMLTLNLINV